MLDRLGVGPQDVLHVSSSLRYDLMLAHDRDQQGLRRPRPRAQHALLLPDAVALLRHSERGRGLFDRSALATRLHHRDP